MKTTEGRIGKASSSLTKSRGFLPAVYAYVMTKLQEKNKGKKTMRQHRENDFFFRHCAHYGHFLYPASSLVLAQNTF
jgi:hypothetical protein